MPRTGNSGYVYNTATNTFRPDTKPLPVPRLKNRKPRPAFDTATAAARPYAPIPAGPKYKVKNG